MNLLAVRFKQSERLVCSTNMRRYAALVEAKAVQIRELADRLLEQNITNSEYDLYEIYYELLYAACDYASFGYNEEYERSHWYFSFRSMMQYYRLVREYGSLHSMKLSENPYIMNAERMLSAELFECSCDGGMGWGYQKKISSEWSSGLIVETDEYFNSEYRLLEALLAIDEWYADEVQKLEILLKKEQALAKRYVPELEAA